MKIISTKETFSVIDVDTELADTVAIFEKWASAALDREVSVHHVFDPTKFRDHKDFQSLAHFAGLTTEEWTEVKECLRNLPKLWLDLPRREGVEKVKLPKRPLFRARRFHLNSQKYMGMQEQTAQWIKMLFPQVSLVLEIVEL